MASWLWLPIVFAMTCLQCDYAMAFRAATILRRDMSRPANTGMRIHFSPTLTPLQAHASTENDGAEKRRRRSQLELGIETAQWLLNDNQRELLLSRLAQQYPIVPQSMLEASIDLVASAVQNVAPNELKQALLPGGMEQMRPALETAIVDWVLRQDVVHDVGILSSDTKSKLIQAIVDLALDELLQDANWVLSTPQARLDVLYEEIRTIRTTEMTTLQFTLYQFRRHPYRYVTGLALGFCYAFRYQYQYQCSYVVQWIQAHVGLLSSTNVWNFAGRAFQTTGVVTSTLWKDLTPFLRALKQRLFSP